MNQMITSPIQSTPQEVMDMASRVADATRQLVGDAIMDLQGKKYIRVEGWQAIAAAHGCTVTVDEIAVIEGSGIAAIARVRRIADGQMLGQAEGFVGRDEVWGKRPMFAQRAMAQTRAISRACRNAFAYVVVAMNSKHATRYETTPAEEIDGEAATRAKVSSKGETKTKIPPWSDDQKREGGELRARAMECGDAAEATFNAKLAAMKYDEPSDTLDALNALVRQLEDVADQARGA